MKVEYSPRAVDALENAPAAVRKAFGKQVEILTNNLMHPSLRAKKYNAAANLWQARVNRDWRFYFVIAEDRYLVTNVIPHPK
jgi:mRNA interferase RelE/StbE